MTTDKITIDRSELQAIADKLTEALQVVRSVTEK